VVSTLTFLSRIKQSRSAFFASSTLFSPFCSRCRQKLFNQIHASKRTNKPLALLLFQQCVSLFCLSLLSPFAMKGNRPPAEANSYQNIKFLSEFSFCSPCWEQHNKPNSFFRKRNLSTKGCCCRLNPEKAKGWKPILADRPYWKDHNWKGLTSINGKSSG
jgi:hypothetical protein